MSTYWHLECISHDPPLRSNDEISQHTDSYLDRVRNMWARREELFKVEKVLGSAPTWSEIDFDSTYERNAWQFIRQHAKCQIQLRSEYGRVEPIERVIVEEPERVSGYSYPRDDMTERERMIHHLRHAHQAWGWVDEPRSLEGLHAFHDGVIFQGDDCPGFVPDPPKPPPGQVTMQFLGRRGGKTIGSEKIITDMVQHHVDTYGWAIEYVYDNEVTGLLDPTKATLHFGDGLDQVEAKKLIEEIARGHFTEAVQRAKKILGQA